MNKERNKFLKAMDWINNHCDTMCLIAVFITSVTPWFVKEDSNGVFSFLGGSWAFCSLLFVNSYDREPESQAARLYSIFGIITLIFGLISLFTANNISEYHAKDPSTNFIYTYVGAFCGMAIGGFVLSHSTKEKDKN